MEEEYLPKRVRVPAGVIEGALGMTSRELDPFGEAFEHPERAAVRQASAG